MAVSKLIAEFVANSDADTIPIEAMDIAKRCVIDGTGVILAGADEPCAQIVRQYLGMMGGNAESRTLGRGSCGAPAALAALANGIAGHALDWDDTALSRERDRSVLIHPTMQPLCAAYAIADREQISGKAFLTAFVLGFEIQVKIAEAIHAVHFTGGRGFHSSGTIGVFGACMTASKLMQLDEQQTLYALAIAATQSAGLGVNHGTMSKPMNMGHACQSGVMAAELARLGFDGPNNPLEGGRGFFEAFGGGFSPERIVDRLGSPWAIIDPGTSIKPYPSGVVGHPGMDAMLELVTRDNITADEVASIRVCTGSNVLAPGPLRISHATTAHEARFCVPFQMAAIILRRNAGLNEFTDSFAASDACQALQRKVEARVDPALDALGKDRVVFDIEVVTIDGRVCRQRSADAYRGGPSNPLTNEALHGKFRDCSSNVLSPEAQAKFLSLAATLDTLDDVSKLLDIVTV